MPCLFWMPQSHLILFSHSTLDVLFSLMRPVVELTSLCLTSTNAFYLLGHIWQHMAQWIKAFFFNCIFCIFILYIHFALNSLLLLVHYWLYVVYDVNRDVVLYSITEKLFLCFYVEMSTDIFITFNSLEVAWLWCVLSNCIYSFCWENFLFLPIY